LASSSYCNGTQNGTQSKVTSRLSQSVGSSPLPRVTQGQQIPIAGLHPLPCTAP
jgi:hypothetical protein